MAKYIIYKGSTYKMIDERVHDLQSYLKKEAPKILDARNFGVKVDPRSQSLKVETEGLPRDGMWGFRIVSESFKEKDISKLPTKRALEKAASDIKAKFQAALKSAGYKMDSWRLEIKTAMGELPRFIIKFYAIPVE